MSFMPDRGDVIWINFDPQVGREQAGRLPALVLTKSLYNASSGLVVVCPIRSRIKGYTYEVLIPSGWAVAGAVLSDHVKSLDYVQRNAALMTRVPQVVVDEVLDKIATLLT